MCVVLVLAEVMDKEPPAYALLLLGVGIAVAAFFAVRFSVWTLLLFLPLACLAADALTSEIRDPFVGPAIVHEAGYSYVVTGYVAAALPLLGCIAGTILNRWRSAPERQQA